MKKLLLAAVLVVRTLAGEEAIEDLGALTPHSMIPLERNTERSDFAFFEIEARNLTDTNHPPLKFVTTNEFLVSSNFVNLPSGKVLLSVRTLTAGTGPSSPVSLYTFELWRARPPAPKARKVVGILHTNDVPDSLEKAVQRMRKPEDGMMPPMPPGMTSPVPLRMMAPKAEPLPGGRSMDYADHLDAKAAEAMNRFYSRARRN